MSLVSANFFFPSLSLTSLSVAKGISANMLKISSKRRRTLKQIKADKEAAAKKEADTQAKLAQLDSMQQRIEQMEADNKMGNDAASLMNQFINAGLVKQDEHDQSWMVANDGSASKFRPVEEQ